MNAEERIAHANNLKNHPSWINFVKDMQDLKELKASEMTAAYMNNRDYAGAFAAGFRLAIETVIEYPDRTIKRNTGLLKKIKQAFTDAEAEQPKQQ